MTGACVCQTQQAGRCERIGIVGVLFVALILGHIYLGTVGMDGAFDAMADGYVDVNWAKEHHSLWAKEEIDKGTVKKVELAVLDRHPDPRWRPLESNKNFLGFYRLKILQ